MKLELLNVLYLVKVRWRKQMPKKQQGGWHKESGACTSTTSFRTPSSPPWINKTRSTKCISTNGKYLRLYFKKPAVLYFSKNRKIKFTIINLHLFDDVADIASPGHEKDDERQYGDHHGHGSDPAEEPPSSCRTLFDICENVDDK